MHRKRLTMDEVRIAAIGARPGPPCFPLLIASDPSSRHIRVPAPPSAIQLERLVESSSLPPLGLGRLLSLPVWLSSLSLRSVPPRSRLTKTVPASTDKCIFSYTPPFP